MHEPRARERPCEERYAGLGDGKGGLCHDAIKPCFFLWAARKYWEMIGSKCDAMHCETAMCEDRHAVGIERWAGCKHGTRRHSRGRIGKMGWMSEAGNRLTEMTLEHHAITSTSFSATGRQTRRSAQARLLLERPSRWRPDPKFGTGQRVGLGRPSSPVDPVLFAFSNPHALVPTVASTKCCKETAGQDVGKDCHKRYHRQASGWQQATQNRPRGWLVFWFGGKGRERGRRQAEGRYWK